MKIETTGDEWKQQPDNRFQAAIEAVAWNMVANAITLDTVTEALAEACKSLRETIEKHPD
jgi:hypothetical protein